MLLKKGSYQKKVSQVFSGSAQLRVAVAFLGKGAEVKFEKSDARKIRLICNLKQGGTNPDVVEKLIALKPKVTVRQLDNLHAKLILGDSSMVLGSANLSSNGLGCEGGKAAALEEIGILSEDQTMLAEAGTWFEAQWRKARAITTGDLDAARKLRADRQGGTPQERPVSRLTDVDQKLLKGRDVRFVIYRDGLSDPADEHVNDLLLKIDAAAFGNCKELDFYEAWADGQLPVDREVVLIPVYFGTRGKVEVHALQQPLGMKNPDLTDEAYDLHVMRVVDDVARLDLPFCFGPKERKQLAEDLRPWLAHISKCFERNGNGLCVPVSEFLQYLGKQG